MSQAKVDRQKEYKKNRKQIMAKEKRQRTFGKAIAYLVAVAILGGLGYSVYNKLTPQKETDSSAYYNLIQTDQYGILDPQLPE